MVVDIFPRTDELMRIAEEYGYTVENAPLPNYTYYISAVEDPRIS